MSGQTFSNSKSSSTNPPMRRPSPNSTIRSWTAAPSSPLMILIETRMWASGNQTHRDPGLRSSGTFHREADLQGHLKVADLALIDMPAGSRDLKPSQMSDGLMGTLDRGIDCLLDAFFR